MGRGLTTAECFLDGGEVPVANTLTGVTELLQRRLGMTRTEFFHTYFTGQKELDVMAALGPAERARFLSRVLGYDRITAAQELARERLKQLFAIYEAEAADLVARQLPAPALDFVLKCSHTFNLLEARGVISVTERTATIGRIRNLARQVAEAWLAEREALGFPLLTDAAEG